MNQINDWLYIGNAWSVRDMDTLCQHGIGAILQLAGEANPHPQTVTAYVSVNDGAYLPHFLLEKGMGFVTEQHRQQKKILIACQMGRSRSVSFGMAALKEMEGCSLVHAYHTIYDQHPLAMPHRQLLRSLCDYYDESYPDLLLELYPDSF